MPAIASAIRRAALFAAVEQVGKKCGCRDLLSDGLSIPVQFDLVARVRRASIEEHFDGVLTVGHSYKKASSAACDQDHLLACFADLVGASRRAGHFELIKQYFAQKKALPPVHPDVLAECSALLSELRFRRKSETRGSVSYELRDDE